LGCNVWKASSATVEVTGVLVSNFIQVLADSVFLIRRSFPDIRKAARREEYSLFRFDVPGSSYTRNVGAGGWELWLILEDILSVVGNAVVSSPRITRGEENTFPARTELAKELTDLLCIGDGDFLLIFAVGDGD